MIKYFLLLILPDYYDPRAWFSIYNHYLAFCYSPGKQAICSTSNKFSDLWYTKKYKAKIRAMAKKFLKENQHYHMFNVDEDIELLFSYSSISWGYMSDSRLVAVRKDFISYMYHYRVTWLSLLVIKIYFIILTLLTLSFIAREYWF